MVGIVKVDTLQNNAGTSSVDMGYVVNGSAKSWVNFEQSSSHTTRDSLNVSSLTDNGFGLTDVAYTSNFDNTNYAAQGGTARQGASTRSAYWLFPTGATVVYSTSATSWQGGYDNGAGSSTTYYDLYLAVATVNGDLA
jgi:hypothetical protein